MNNYRGGRATSYEVAKANALSQINNMLMVFGMMDRSVPVESDAALDRVHQNLLSTELASVTRLLALLDVMNDFRNDQIQSSARELVRGIAGRLRIDIQERHGVPLDPKPPE